MSNTNVSPSSVTVEITPEIVQAVLRELALAADDIVLYDDDRLRYMADMGGYSLVAFQRARRWLEKGGNPRTLLNLCVKYVEMEPKPFKDVADAMMLGKVRGLYQATWDGAFRDLSYFGHPSDVETLRAEIRRVGDDSVEWRVMAWVELAEAAAVLFSDAHPPEKVRAGANVAQWIAEGLAGHDPEEAEGFVNALRDLAAEEVQ